jgi:hypothetical protein
MAFGAFAPMPLRLGGSAQEGWTAEQHARIAADLVNVGRVAPLAVLTYDSSGTIVSYMGQNGVGPAHAPTVNPFASFVRRLDWERAYRGPRWLKGAREEEFPWAISHIQIHPHDQTTGTWNGACSSNRVLIGGNVPGRATLIVYGTWLPAPSIGSYGGDPNKENSSTEGETPYAAAVYRDLQSMRGSAYTTKPATFVHAENLALARLWGYTAYRLPEKMRASAVPARSDERLPYWVNVLGIAVRPGEEQWQIRQRCAAAYKATLGPIISNVQQVLRDLLGPEVYVDANVPDYPSLVTDPPQTYWPGGDPGFPEIDLGGGTWTSRRSQLIVKVNWPPSMTYGEFVNLLDVQMYQVLDDLLPAWMTWTWYRDGGFLLDESSLDIDGFDS